MRLRPHHLLCVQGYRGKGYDAAFCANMARIARALDRDPTLPVIVTEGPDDICAACPHLKDGRCTWQELGGGGGVGQQPVHPDVLVREHDAALLRAFRLADGDVVTIRAVRERVTSNPEIRRVVTHYCETCPWVLDCAFAQGVLHVIGS